MDENILQLLTTQISEVKDSIRRVHERIDEMIKAGYMTRTECEGYRSSCKKGGSPPWVVVLFSVSSSLIVFVATLGFFLYKGAH